MTSVNTFIDLLFDKYKFCVNCEIISNIIKDMSFLTNYITKFKYFFRFIETNWKSKQIFRKQKHDYVQPLHFFGICDGDVESRINP